MRLEWGGEMEWVWMLGGVSEGLEWSRIWVELYGHTRERPWEGHSWNRRGLWPAYTHMLRLAAGDRGEGLMFGVDSGVDL